MSVKVNIKGISVKELPSNFFKGKSADIAKKLLGKLLIRDNNGKISGGLIVETEAYLGRNDPSCHSSRGLTKRTEPFFKGAGTMYVFRSRHHCCFNMITEHRKQGEGILIRALEPLIGIKDMKRNRGNKPIEKLANGPGNICKALQITAEMSGKKLGNGVYILNTSLKEDVVATRRIGISKAVDWPLRFVVKDSKFVSKKMKPVRERDWSKFYRKEFGRE